MQLNSICSATSSASIFFKLRSMFLHLYINVSQPYSCSNALSSTSVIVT